MKAVFDDPQFSFQMLRALGGAVYGGAEIGECLSTAYRIKEGDFESWHSEWLATAERVHEIADDCLSRGHEVSAREAYIRATSYYRLSEFYLHGDPNDPRISELSKKSMDCFAQFARLVEPEIEEMDIPYEGTTLPAYFYRVDDSGVHRPTLVLQTGFDGTIEELYGGGFAATRRGFNCLTFEGPGQGRVIREKGLPFRYDWEKVMIPVVDYALTLGEVDPKRIALMGLSFGGYLVPRAAAFEHRVAACIANGGVYDFLGSRLPEGMTAAAMEEYIKSNTEEFENAMKEMMKTKTELRWAVENGMFTFKASSPSDWYLKGLKYSLKGVAEKITCPTLVIDTEADTSFQGQAKKLFDALTCPKEFMLFTAGEGAEDHCQVGSQLLSHQRVFDWLEETLANAG